MAHPFVIEELACGYLSGRPAFSSLMRQQPSSMDATPDEVLIFIENHSLMGRGIGYVDTHLLAAVALSDSATLWTRDKRLREIAREMRAAFADN